MVNCSCGKPLVKVPTWLAGTSIQFVCNNCPNRTVKAITQIVIEPIKDPEAEAMEAIAAEVKDEDDDKD